MKPLLMPRILFMYIGRQFFVTVGVLLLMMTGLVFIIDFIEIARRAGRGFELALPMVAKMALLKMPEAGQRIMPFAVLFGAMFTFWRLTKSSELVVARAGGMSVWQFTLPLVAGAALLGTVATTLINPAASLLLSRYAQMEQEHLGVENSLVTLSKTGIWLRQSITTGERAQKDIADTDGYAIIHAEGFNPTSWQFHDVSVFFMEPTGALASQLTASSAVLTDHAWQLADVNSYDRDGIPQPQDAYTLATSLTRDEIEESFAAPETLSFWEIQEYIALMKEMGFSATRLQAYFHSLLAQPLFFAAMVLLAACVSLRLQRHGGTARLIFAGVFLGFFIFFMDSVMAAFGIGNKLPVALAAWTPAMVTFLLGVTVLLHFEDG